MENVVFYVQNSKKYFSRLRLLSILLLEKEKDKNPLKKKRISTHFLKSSTLLINNCLIFQFTFEILRQEETKF